MNEMYGFPLFTSKDIKKAFNYLFRSSESDKILNEDLIMYNLQTINDDTTGQMIILANIKKTQNILNNELLPELGDLLSLIGQDYNFIIFNPDPISALYNPLYKNDSIDKFIFYISTKMKGMSTLWIRFNGFISKELEQLINLKYKDYISLDNNGYTWIQLTPDENFSFILDLIDDILYLI